MADLSSSTNNIPTNNFLIQTGIQTGVNRTCQLNRGLRDSISSIINNLIINKSNRCGSHQNNQHSLNGIIIDNTNRMPIRCNETTN